MMGDGIRSFTNKILERANDVAFVQLVGVVTGKFDCGARRTGPGRTSRLEINRLPDPEIVALPQSEREWTHVERIHEPASATQDVVAQVIASLGSQRGIRGISASVVLVASEIDEENGGGVGDGEDLEGPVGQERTG